MKSVIGKSTVLFVIFGFFESCGILYPRNKEPLAKMCFFDPVTRNIILESKNIQGIRRIEIELFDTTLSEKKSYIEQNYVSPIKKIDLNELDTGILVKSTLIIKIWESKSIIEDYELIINPADWNKSKKIYSRYSSR